MFKVECLGCQAPYQVDEKRVPDKGLKMRCPKCGTSFRVEPPAGSTGTGGAPIEPADGPETPASAPRPFTSGGLEPGKVSGKAPGSARDPLSRTMIGVSSADLGLGPKAPAGEEAKRRPFRIPRPNVGAPAAVAPAAIADAAKAAEPTAVSSPLEAPPAFAAEPGQVQEAWIPAESEAPPASLAEPSSPLSLSELPQPVVSGGLRQQPTLQMAKVTSLAPEGLELDYSDDLPVAALPGRKPPPRRGRALTTADKTGAAFEAKLDQPAPAPETIDLPARLEDLQSSSPQPAPVRAAPPAPAAERAPSRPKSSSLDELDLPDLPSRDGVAGLPAPRLPRRAELVSAAGPPPAPPKAAPAVAKAAPNIELELDLPAVGTAATRSRRPALSDLPDVWGTGLPDVLGAGLPDVARAGLPEVLGAGLPEVLGAGLPDVARAGLPDVLPAGLPELFAAGLPAVSAAGLPVVSAAGLPAVSRAGLPQVVTAGLPEVAGSALPDVLRAGLPVVT